MKALVTGADGFIGSHLVEALMKRGWEVRASVLPGADLRHLPAWGIEIQEGAVADPRVARAAVRGVSHVFHVAGEYVSTDPHTLQAANVATTEALLRACEGAGGAARFVFISSFAAAGPSAADRPRREADAAAPVNEYGRTKLTAEGLIGRSRARLATTILRPPAVIGPRDPNFLHMFRWIQGTSAFPKFGRRARYTNLLDVRDLCEALIRIAGAPQAVGATYFVANPAIHSFDHIIEEVGRAAGRRGVRRLRLPDAVLHAAGPAAMTLERLTGQRPKVSGGYLLLFRERYWTADMGALEAALGWLPSTPLTTSLADAASWYRTQGLLTEARRAPSLRALLPRSA